MRSIRMAALGLLCLGTAVAARPAAARSDAAVRAAISAGYTRFVGALQHKSTQELEALFAPGFSAKGPDGEEQDRSRTIAQFTGIMRACQTISWPNTILTLKVNGGTASVTRKGALTGTIVGPDKKPHSLVMDMTSSDVWVKSGAAWLMKRTVVTSARAFMDGTPMPLGKGRTAGAKPAPKKK